MNVRGMGVHTLITSPVALGITAGLVLGKPIGVIAGAEISGRLAKVRRSAAVKTADLLAIGMLAGIGFTVSLLVSELAFPEGAQLDEAKTAVLIASVISAVLAGAVLLMRRRHYAQTNQRDLDEELPDVPEETSDPATEAASD